MDTLFSVVLDGIIDNNETNDGQFCDWTADEAIDMYGGNFDGDCPKEELELTIDALSKIIESNGRNVDDVVREFNEAVYIHG